jgi:hypothetical protein
VENNPKAQLEHREAAAAEYRPAPQLEQLDDVDAPVMVLNIPSTQPEQLDDPVKGWYVPPTQLVQALDPAAP